jgi:cyanate permease
MGRHVDAAGPPTDIRRTAQVCGLAGGLAWVLTYFLDTGSGVADALLWLGALLMTVALFVLGLTLVKSDVLPLRVFVAVALPTLVWGVVGLALDSAHDPRVVDLVFGAVVGGVSALQLTRRPSASRSTL